MPVTIDDLSNMPELDGVAERPSPVTFRPEPKVREASRAVISTDDHVAVPPQIWERRFPAKRVQTAPPLVGADDRGHRWL